MEAINDYTNVPIEKRGVDYTIASVLIFNPRNSEKIRHIDGDLNNNDIDNLEWA